MKHWVVFKGENDKSVAVEDADGCLLGILLDKGEEVYGTVSFMHPGDAIDYIDDILKD